MLSDEPAEDLQKFCRWLERYEGKKHLNVTARVLDLGCGNGRHLIFLAEEYHMRGVGYDISEEGIKIAKRASYFPKDGGGELVSMPITYEVRSIAEKIDLPDSSVDIVLDMMTSHFLNEEERAFLLSEIVRVLKPGGWLFFKSFLAEKDLHVRRLLKENPAEEKDTYVHPALGVTEHVWTEVSLREFMEPYLVLHKVERSHKHMRDGKAFKRRTIVAYFQKPH